MVISGKYYVNSFHNKIILFYDIQKYYPSDTF
jgi:hypothetical protein